MIKKDINSREDVHLLVSSFYDKVRKDDFLGPFFNEAISDWDKHIDHLTDFLGIEFVSTYKIFWRPFRKAYRSR